MAHSIKFLSSKTYAVNDNGEDRKKVWSEGQEWQRDQENTEYKQNPGEPSPGKMLEAI